MHNDSTTISANEVNRFVYCPYQWYYQRVYGSKKLRVLVKERNAEYGIEYNPGKSAFERGNQFHHRYHSRYKLKRAVSMIFYLLCAAALAGAVIWVMNGG